MIDKSSSGKHQEFNTSTVERHYSPGWIQYQTLLLDIHTSFRIITLGSHTHFIINCFMHCLQLQTLASSFHYLYSYILWHSFILPIQLRTLASLPYKVTDYGKLSFSHGVLDSGTLFLPIHLQALAKPHFIHAYKATDFGIHPLCP